jgi:ubiquinone/menaquinone biosynthesis C-methylase UbiE
VGNAMHLDAHVFDDNSFDAVINVESSHCYPDFDAFLRQVLRILKVNGKFNICDFRTKQEWVDIERMFHESSEWTVTECVDITPQVLKSSKIAEQYSRSQIEKHIPYLLMPIKNILLNFILAENSVVHKRFVDGSSQYKLIRLKKQK